MSGLLPGPPLPRRGWQQVLRLQRLVVAVWVASWLAIAPALLVLSQTAGRGLAALPAGPGEAPVGDAGLIILEAVREAWTPLAVAVLGGLVAAWAWTVLWHAGVVRWTLSDAGGPVRLGRLLRPGIAAWWRYARLSLTALAALAVAAGAVWLLVWWGAARGLAAMTENRLIALAAGGALASAAVVIVIWLATVRGAWLLGLPGRRSAALAWLAGLRVTLRRPLPGLWAWLVWVVPALLVSAVVPLLGAAFPRLRGGLLLVVLGLLASLLRAFCWVGLFCSFAPAAGAVEFAVGHVDPVADGGVRELGDGAEATPPHGRPSSAETALSSSTPSSGAEADAGAETGHIAP